MLTHEAVAGFLSLFQSGMGMRAQVGCTVESFLCEQLGIDRRYLEDRIRTIFLDGKAVDEVKSTFVRDGSVLALSAAMPGLLGAALKKGGPFASLRSSVSHNGKRNPSEKVEGTVILKLFNFLSREIGPNLLAKGLWVRDREVKTFLETWPSSPGRGPIRAFSKGVEIPPDRLPGSLRPSKYIFVFLP
ncbi:MAG: hypothetical protein JRH06_08150 [Deltaproteobacteria bacterium]|nr:hypothetical protein [Deltaproteobacteria bacterium]MBW2137515.1 hypothetical protein [Deltaproteobacteria bacterium]